jgi:hypothetical protein
MEMHNDDLSPSEREALEALPKERTPSPFLENRVVNALRRRGVLRPAERQVIEVTRLRLVGAVAASILLLIAGFAMGHRTASRQIAPTGVPRAEPGDVPIPATVQQVGTAYVSALEELALLPVSTGSDEVLQGREVALTTFYTAATQVKKIVPREHLATHLLQALDIGEAAGTFGEDDGHQLKVISF